MHPGLLVLGGFLLGTAGLKAVSSRCAHKAYVRGTVCALQCKDYVSRAVDEVKAQCDDILAEAEYVKAAEDAERDAEKVVVDETTVAEGKDAVVAVEKTVVEEKTRA